MGQKVNRLKTNFSSGEVSPLIVGRTDITRNQNGYAEGNNFIVQPSGGLTRRMGTIFIRGVKHPTKKTRLIPFQFSDSESFVLEFGEEYIRFYSDHEILLDGGSPYEVSTGYQENELDDLYFCQSADVLYIAHKNYRVKTLARFDTLDWQFGNAVFEDGPYFASQYTDVNITLWLKDIVARSLLTSTVTDFSVGDVGKFVEYYDEGFQVIAKIIDFIDGQNVRVEPYENIIDFAAIDKQAVIDYATTPDRVRASLSIWSSETEYSYIKVGGTWRWVTTHQAAPEQVGSGSSAYVADVMNADSAQDPVIVSTTGEITVVKENITAVLKASSALFEDPRDINRHFRLTLGSRNVWGWIETITNSKRCEVKLGTMVPLDAKNRTKYLNDATTTNWKLGAWYEENYPQVVTIHQQRLFFACTKFEPNRVWASSTDDFVSFSTANKFAEVLDTSGINFSVGTGEVNPIRWMQSGPVLLIGTQSEEFQVKPGSISEPLTPTNIAITQQTSYGGCKNIKPIKIGSATLFMQKHKTSLRELSYDFQIDSFVASDMSIIAEHIIRQNGVAIAMAYQQIPWTTIWVVCSNGKLVSFTYEKEHQVFAWAQHALVDADIESICSIPNNSGSRDEVYFVVKRTIDGSEVRYVEYFAPEFRPVTANQTSGMIYLDSSIKYSGAPTTTITGLDHLEGELVGILGDRGNHPDLTVTGGEIELQYEVSEAYVGKKFTSYVKTLSQDGGSTVGTAIGKLQKVHRVDILLHVSLGLKYGRKYPSDEPLAFIAPEPILGAAPDMFTGWKTLTDDAGFNQDSQFYIVQEQPYPLTILSLAPVVVVNE
jgi:hypothetical protein